MNEWQKTWPAPAKLNLFLHVIGRRDDGYHLIQTVFRLIGCYDLLRFAPSATIELGQPLPGVREEDELCVRAAHLLQGQTRCRKGVTVFLDKRIPIGGGMGGGSSDAATTLWALNRLWDLRLPRERLAALGLRLGADVPFFLFGRNAFAEGVGEVLAQIELPAAWYVVLVPPVAVPTARMFADPGLTRDTKSIKISGFSIGLGHNDLEPVACRHFPEVRTYLTWLSQFGTARMSGSGACVFAEFGSEAAARSVVSRLPDAMRGFVAPSLDRHPLTGGTE
ncbi:MAG: 4-(cytidine 5'-diphospho)-2-C-methyl-D-erythritol kinase [Betaproteobacteria bacterium]|nr:4-(cytidine 5'-diphospho)-2-C-methyl-D-erythritol kinase [Betaproteobacteria bacterium]